MNRVEVEEYLDSVAVAVSALVELLSPFDEANKLEIFEARIETVEGIYKLIKEKHSIRVIRDHDF